MSTDFSREHKTPTNRFRPGPGQVGTQAGLAAAKQPSGGASRPPRQSPPDSKRGGGLGLPMMPAEPEPTGDYRHLVALAQHQNIKDLGHDAPVGIQLINNGDFRQLFKPGQVPFDWFLDT